MVSMGSPKILLKRNTVTDCWIGSFNCQMPSLWQDPADSIKVLIMHHQRGDCWTVTLQSYHKHFMLEQPWHVIIFVSLPSSNDVFRAHNEIHAVIRQTFYNQSAARLYSNLMYKTLVFKIQFLKNEQKNLCPALHIIHRHDSRFVFSRRTLQR